MSRDTIAYLSLQNLRHNVSRVRALAPNSQVLSVLKADAYGHGFEHLAPLMAEHSDGLGVAHLEEALQLRELGVENTPVMILEGALSGQELSLAAQQGFQLAVHNDEQLRMLEQHRLPRPVVVWLKINTGMNRLGIQPMKVKHFWQRLQQLQWVEEVRLMSHFACADEPDHSMNQRQLEVFAHCTHGIEAARSFSNSAAVCALPQSHFDWVRPGIMLYGGSPLLSTSADQLGLKPVMTLQAPILSIQELGEGATAGYGARWQAGRKTRLAVIGIGYGDGYPRTAVDGTPVAINGQRVPLAGRVSMDMITVDVTELPDVQVGQIAELWGPNVAADEVASHSDTISYELFCRLTQRVKRIVADDKEAHFPAKAGTS